MASRFSAFHTSLHRPKLIMGVEKGMFGVLALFSAVCFGIRAYPLLPMVGVLFFVGRWLSKVDDQYIAVLASYLREEHVYDATPRPADFQQRPKGWGKGIPR